MTLVRGRVVDGWAGREGRGHDGGVRITRLGHAALLLETDRARVLVDPGAFSTAFEAFDELADEAPKEVEDDWAVLQDGVQEIEDAFADAGLALDDLSDVMTGDIPEGVDLEKLQELGTTLEELDSEEFNDATEAISEHAEEECGITLGEE
jgi:hypothetical protein